MNKTSTHPMYRKPTVVLVRWTASGIWEAMLDICIKTGLPDVKTLEVMQNN